jgi:hypothetical protein
MSQGTEQHLEHAEHARHAAHDPFDRRVAMTMAIIAAMLALVTMLSHREHNETLLHQAESNIFQTQANDQWNYFQVKKNRGYMDQAWVELVPLLAKDSHNSDSETKSAQLVNKYQGLVAKYKKESAEAKEQAEKLEEQAKKSKEASERAHHRADHFDYGELGVEVALVLCSIAVLTKNSRLWASGIVIGLIGFAAALWGFVAA